MAFGNQANVKAVITAEDRASAILNKFGKGVDKTSERIVKSMKVAGIAVAAAGAAASLAFGKFVIKGGIDRALNIEDAQAKLKGLGHTTQGIEKIMVSALDSVKGTAFGLDAAATTAASAVAAGIKPGQELTKYLTLTADAATIAGIGLSDMGRVMNKVTTVNAAYNDSLLELSEKGIPIYQLLAKETGKTAEEVKEMASEGKISAEVFREALTKNVGGAALESGKTTRGAWANMQAAMARVGAAIVKDIIPKVRDGFGDMTKWFDDNSDRIVESVSNIVEMVQEFGKRVGELGREVGDYLNPKLEALWNTLSKDLMPALMKFWKKIIEPLLPVIGTALVVAVGAAIDVFNIFADAAAKVIDFLADNEWVFWSIVTVLGAIKAAMITKQAWGAAIDGIKLLKSAYETLAIHILYAKDDFIKMKDTMVDTAKMVVHAAKVGTAWVINAVKASAAWAWHMTKIVAGMAVKAPFMIAHAADVGLAWVINAIRASFVWVTQELPKIVVGFVKTAAAATVHAVATSAAWIASAAKSAFAWVTTQLPRIVGGFFVTSASAVTHAAISSAAWIAAASRSAIAWVVTQLPRIIAAFAVTSASAVAHAAIASGAWVGAAAKSTASFKAMAALIATPLVMPAIVVAAALASLFLVKRAAAEVKRAVEDVNNTRSAVSSAVNSDDAVMRRLRHLMEYGTPDQQRRAKATFSGLASGGAFASGTSFAPGGVAIVGERGPEQVILPRGSQVVPTNSTRESGNTINLSVNVGVYTGSEIEKRKLAKTLLRSLQDMASSQGMSVGELLGT